MVLISPSQVGSCLVNILPFPSLPFPISLAIFESPQILTNAFLVSVSRLTAPPPAPHVSYSTMLSPPDWLSGGSFDTYGAASNLFHP